MLGHQMNTQHDFSRNLDGDERLLWSGQPVQGVVFSGRDALLIPFSLLWCGFAIFWESSVVLTDAPFFFKLWGIPFVLVGLYFVFGRFAHDAYRRSNTYYGITNKRVIIKKGNKVDSIARGKWATIKLTEYADGRGTISFSDSDASWYRGRRMGSWMATPSYPAFFKIRDARRLYRMLSDEEA